MVLRMIIVIVGLGIGDGSQLSIAHRTPEAHVTIGMAASEEEDCT